MAHTGAAPEAQLLKRAVDELVARTGLPVAFGGYEIDDAVKVSAITGARTASLEGLVVHKSRGLGGRAIVERRPRLAIDYRTSRNITHDYDRHVLGEGISTLFAVPILVGGETRGVLYCGSWLTSPFGDQVARSAFAVAAELGTELRVRDEVARQVSLTQGVPASSTVAPAAREELREAFMELRSIASIVADEDVRSRLAKLERRIAALSRDASDHPDEPVVHLSPRETDVLACAAMGATNAEIASTLLLKEGTVKSYMQSAMSKLDASTRHAAVTRARRVGILP